VTSGLFKYVLTQSFLWILTVVAWGQNSNAVHGSKPKSKTENTLQLDTSKTSIIPLSKTGSYPFGESYRRAVLTKLDVKIIDSLVEQCVADYNSSLKPEFKHFGIDLNRGNYRKQLVAATNTKGEKEVWINCFCRADDIRWKTEIMYVDDGGSCYFKLRVNLTKGTYYDLGVNCGG
jgi:hypothetical protein